MRSPVTADLVSLMTWRLVVAVSQSYHRTRLLEMTDPVDGTSLILSQEDQPYSLAISHDTGLTVVAPILFERLAWSQIVGRDISTLVGELRSSLAWQSGGQPGGAETARSLISEVLAMLWSDPSEWWIRSAQAHESLDDFPTLNEWLVSSVAQDFKLGLSPTHREMWVLFQDASPAAAFDDRGGIHAGPARWSYLDLLEELEGDQVAVAFYCLRAIRSALAFAG